MSLWGKIRNSGKLYHIKPKKNKNKSVRSQPKVKDHPLVRHVSVERGEAYAFYQSFEWRKLRYTILKKYGRKCMLCGATEGQFHVDHIKPIRKYWNLRLEPDNLQVLCAECNHGKGSWDETDFRP